MPYRTERQLQNSFFSPWNSATFMGSNLYVSNCVQSFICFITVYTKIFLYYEQTLAWQRPTRPNAQTILLFILINMLPNYYYLKHLHLSLIDWPCERSSSSKFVKHHKYQASKPRNNDHNVSCVTSHVLLVKKNNDNLVELVSEESANFQGNFLNSSFFKTSGYYTKVKHIKDP